MPIYEYLCKPCNRVFSFYNRSLNSDARPVCPKCGGTEMKKLMSMFATTHSTHDQGSAAGDDPQGDPRTEREMMKLMSAAEKMDENDPRQLGALMRKMSDLGGEKLDGEMEEAVRRLEAGEDPEKIEADLGDFWGEGPDDGTCCPGGCGAPSYDSGLYDM
jgi:putative FmdB family regulatory protein